MSHINGSENASLRAIEHIMILDNNDFHLLAHFDLFIESSYFSYELPIITIV